MPFLNFAGGVVPADAAFGVPYFRRESNDRAYSGQSASDTPSTVVAASIPVDTLQAVPYYVGNAQQIARIGVSPSAGVGDCWLGVYDNVSLENPYPGNRLFDSGQFTPIGGNQFLPCVLSLTERSLFWLVVNVQAGNTRSYVCTSQGESSGLWSVLGRPTGATWSGPSQGGSYRVASAFALGMPDPFPAGATPFDTSGTYSNIIVTLVPG